MGHDARRRQRPGAGAPRADDPVYAGPASDESPAPDPDTSADARPEDSYPDGGPYAAPEGGDSDDAAYAGGSDDSGSDASDWDEVREQVGEDLQRALQDLNGYGH